MGSAGGTSRMGDLSRHGRAVQGQILRTKTGREAGYSVGQDHQDKQVFTTRSGPCPASSWSGTGLTW